MKNQHRMIKKNYTKKEFKKERAVRAPPGFIAYLLERSSTISPSSLLQLAFGGPDGNSTHLRCIASAPRPLGTCRPILFSLSDSHPLTLATYGSFRNQPIPIGIPQPRYGNCGPQNGATKIGGDGENRTLKCCVQGNQFPVSLRPQTLWSR